MTRAEKINYEWLLLVSQDEFDNQEIDKDGWLIVSHHEIYHKYDISLAGDWRGKGMNYFDGKYDDILSVRPQNLDKIDCNNGWLKIEDNRDIFDFNRVYELYSIDYDMQWYGLYHSILRGVTPTHFKEVKFSNKPIY